MLGTCGGILEAFQMLGGKIGGVEGGMRRGEANGVSVKDNK